MVWIDQLKSVLPENDVLSGEKISESYGKDEILGELLLREKPLDVFLLSPSEAAKILEGREGSFSSGKGADWP